MKNRKLLITILICVVITIILGVVSLQASVNQANASVLKTDSIAVRPVSSQIVADGTVAAQDTATFHFQTGGKLIYLPHKEGDTVQKGQTIAQLDPYPLQQQLTAALNTYRSTRDTFDQTQQNDQKGLLQDAQHTLANQQGAGFSALGVDTNATDYINDVAKRIVDENQANLDNSVINVQLANYALQMATLTSPLTGIITHEDVTVANQNVTPTTSFTVVDPKTLVFRAQVSENDIDFVTIGSHADVQLNGNNSIYSVGGEVSKIYPDKQTLANGKSVYQVDVSVPNLATTAKLDQTGIVTITGSESTAVMLVPAWTVLGHQSIWVVENGKQVLKHITLGKTHGNMIEVTSGLSPEDSVIVNPAAIAAKHYQML